MKDHSQEDLMIIIERQQKQIDRLEKQVNGLLGDKNCDDNDNKIPAKENGHLNNNDDFNKVNDRFLDLEDVVTDMKGEMMELMLVYQDIQDKLFDIDRY